MTNKINAITNAITNARNLDDLRSALREAGLILTTEPRLDDLVDLTSLPTYGGQPPHDTSGIWSWDAERLLVGDGSDWEIVDRDE